MDCGALPGTGGPAATWLAAGLLCCLIGWLLVRRGRPDRRRGRGVLIVAVVATAFVVGQPSPGQASDDCDVPDESAPTPHALIITQTSVVDGLAPGIDPVAITGQVTNPSHDSTYVTHVTVRIMTVTKATGSSAGECSAADYRLENPRMPVNRSLPKFSSVAFSGASLGFESTLRNQDACKRATVRLGYVSGSR